MHTFIQQAIHNKIEEKHIKKTLTPLHFSVHLSNARINQYSQSFFTFSGKLWNSLPAFVFPISYDLNSFKREVPRHLFHSLGPHSRNSFGDQRLSGQRGPGCENTLGRETHNEA